MKNEISAIKITPALLTLAQISRNEKEEGKEKRASLSCNGAGKKAYFLECWQTYKTTFTEKRWARGLLRLCHCLAFARAEFSKNNLICKCAVLLAISKDCLKYFYKVK